MADAEKFTEKARNWFFGLKMQKIHPGHIQNRNFMILVFSERQWKTPLFSEKKNSIFYLFQPAGPAQNSKSQNLVARNFRG
jgi:hypothetical protein